MTEPANNVEAAEAQPAAVAKPVRIALTLDAEDHAWLLEQGYPYALDAAGYLRMFVRRGRLGLSPRADDAPQPQPRPRYAPEPRHLDEIERENYFPPPSAAPDSAAIDDLVASVVGEAEALGALAPQEEPGDHPGARGTGQVVALTQRGPGLFATPSGGDGPHMTLAQAWGRRN